MNGAETSQVGVPTGNGLDLIGLWDVTITTPVGLQQAQYEFMMPPSSHPDALRGVARQGADTTELGEVQVNGREISWTQRVTRPMKLTLKCTVTVEQDKLTGTARAGALPASKVSGTRIVRPL